jgi:ribonucleoside-triphosphate reductase
MYAPYLEDMTDAEIRQEAQHLMFQTSQNAFSRGGQALFIDFNIHTGIPGYLKNIKAIGPGGKYTGRTYASYEDTAMRFTRALLEISGEGDGNGSVFAFPKIDMHINAETLEDPKQREILEYACEVASKNGSIYFIFDRDEVTLSACCRLRTQIDDNYMIEHPESMRYCGFQNVTINLPQCAYRAGKGNYDEFKTELEKMFNICIKAHLQKKEFIHGLMHSPSRPLWQIGRKAKDGRPYVDLEAATYIVGVLGLNECLQYLFDVEIHESEEALWQGLRIISYLHFLVKGAAKKYGLKFTIEESPAESASGRLARIDARNYKDAIVRGSGNALYYTNSIHLRPDADVSLAKRISFQSRYHNLIESGAIIHAFCGEHLPSPKSIMNIVEKTFKNTSAAQLTISPEFTLCSQCGHTTLGLKDKCENCEAYNINGISVGELNEALDGLQDWDKKVLGQMTSG